MFACSVPVLRVALPLPLPHYFDYLPPPGSQILDATAIGRRIQVPFGRRELVGIVADIGTSDTTKTLRPALAWLDDDPVLRGELLASLRWLARYLHAPPGEVFAVALPALLRRGQPLPDTRQYGWELSAEGRRQLATLRSGSRLRALAEGLQATAISELQLEAQWPHWRRSTRDLEQRGFIHRIEMPADVAALPFSPQPGPALNAQQQAAVTAICSATRFQAFLLDGITGSGKTEVYLHALAQCLQQGKQALVLVPEIGLTPQLLARFQQRLGVVIHTFHSGMSDAARAKVWAAAWRGQAPLIVGTRSAIFTPLPKAGLIIIDEEHDASYKQQDGLRYHARDFALVRAKALSIPIILGSATPSLESLHNVLQQRYVPLHLHRRAAEAKLPQVRVLDIRKRRLFDGLSDDVLTAMTAHLQAGHQVLVFRNRRGYAPVLLCHDCGWNATCARCSTDEHPAAMTVHAGSGRLQCHHCGSRAPIPKVCPDCSSLALHAQGIGTQRLEERLQQHFSNYPVLRIDRDTTRHRDALEKTLKTLGDTPGILIGTQMLAKGHDLPNLTLVVVVTVDSGLFSSDFRASEKMAQQLIQVSGRAGRAQHPGQVLLQTHYPEHTLLHTLLNGGYPAFARAELAQRHTAGFPPFAHLALLRAEAQNTEQIHDFLDACKRYIPAESTVECYGPLPAPRPRRAGYSRSQLLLSAPQRSILHALLKVLVPHIYAHPLARAVRWSLDIDPVDLY